MQHPRASTRVRGRLVVLERSRPNAELEFSSDQIKSDQTGWDGKVTMRHEPGSLGRTLKNEVSGGEGPMEAPSGCWWVVVVG